MKFVYLDFLLLIWHNTAMVCVTYVYFVSCVCALCTSEYVCAREREKEGVCQLAEEIKVKIDETFVK